MRDGWLAWWGVGGKVRVVFALFQRVGPFASGNVRRYVGFTVLYNARAYYPVLAVMFTDMGLTLDQFVLLNLVWALTIFVLEVPSGALADTLGRRKLLLAASWMMVVEMLVLLAAPRGAGGWLFAMCVVNRFLSGASEAAASGADEAAAYESLPEEGRVEAWDEVMAVAMKARAVGVMVMMALGGWLYGSGGVVWGGWEVPVGLAQRLPLVLVLLQALGCVGLVWGMKETMEKKPGRLVEKCREAVGLTLETALLAWRTRAMAVVIGGGLLIDAVARNFATITSEYYRWIGISERWYGLIGAVGGIVAFGVPRLAKAWNARWEVMGVLRWAALVTGVAMMTLAWRWPWHLGVLPVMVLMMMLGLVGYSVSRHLHASVESSRRATLLSVKGLAFQLGYGMASLGFSRALAFLREEKGAAAFAEAMKWQGPVFLTLVAGYFVVEWVMARRGIRRGGRGCHG